MEPIPTAAEAQKACKPGKIWKKKFLESTIRYVYLFYIPSFLFSYSYTINVQSVLTSSWIYFCFLHHEWNFKMLRNDYFHFTFLEYYSFTFSQKRSRESYSLLSKMHILIFTSWVKLRSLKISFFFFLG